MYYDIFDFHECELTINNSLQSLNKYFYKYINKRRHLDIFSLLLLKIHLYNVIWYLNKDFNVDWDVSKIFLHSFILFSFFSSSLFIKGISFLSWVSSTTVPAAKLDTLDIIKSDNIKRMIQLTERTFAGKLRNM